jgi:sigma-B regulation protein RsbU (phosphoserine phosphatase)
VIDRGAGRFAPGPFAAVGPVLAEGVAVLDAGGAFRAVDPAVAALLGRRREDLLGRTAADVFPDAVDLLECLSRARAAETATPLTWQGWIDPGGDQRSVTARAWEDLLLLTVRPARPSDGDGGDAERDRLAYLARVTETMIGTLDTGESATRLAELAVSRLGDWAIVVVGPEDGRAAEEGRAHRDPARRRDVDVYRDRRLPVTRGDNPIAVALRTGRPVQLAPLDHDRVTPTLNTDEVREAWRRLDTTSAVVVPLRARGDTFGAMVLMNSGDRPAHTEREIATAVEVARRGALALDNARLYGRQLAVAETLQRSLLTPPMVADPQRLEIAVRYRPAARYQEVGGDWYDAFAQPDGASALVIGDVVGHDVEATAAMSQIRSMLRALAHDQPGSPAHILDRLDQVLTGLHADTMATALLARVELPGPGAGAEPCTIRWSSAGHPAPLVLTADGRVRVLDSPPQRPLGTGWTGARRDDDVRLCPGDMVLLITDGLLEQGRLDLDRGLSRLTSALSACAGLSVEAVCDRLLDSVVPGRADDDIALLALRYCPGNPRGDAGTGPGEP